ncbi:MAG: polyribonucleotide nucleotidyltransferase [Deltaproteobacteria bacterium]|nr:polyribonucleotide nucleotidyltransferase [Deltaproteobacteria bacterium]
MTNTITHKVSCEVGGRQLTIETGQLAKQAHGSVLVSFGDTRVLVTVCSASKPKEGIDYVPMTVEFSEKYYAAGKIPGSFHRREGRPTQEATLSARMIDRPIRPLFPEGYYYDTQIVASVLSVDLEADVDVAASVGASAALHISDIPFNGPTAACCVGRVANQFVINPSWTQLQEGHSDLDIFVAGTEKAIMMVEGGADEVSEEDALQAILLGHEEIKKMIKIIHELRTMAGKPKKEIALALPEKSLKAQIDKLAKTETQKALCIKEKQLRYQTLDKIKENLLNSLVPESVKKQDQEKAKKLSNDIQISFDLLKYNLMREMILSEKVRIDGRDTKTIRPINVEVGLLPRTHGSALFTRGETQVLSTITLGTADDEQIIDTMFQKDMKKFMLHYNFPPFAVGETGRFGGNSRREIGHGALAERSINAMMPEYDKFPYTVRIVCETLESNGSSSMGSVCAASMALMDAGVSFPKPVAGIAMGLIKEQERIAILSDILGDEDHLGDMDFKVAGTDQGITGIQMDIKIEGVNEAIMREALTQAKEGRLHILNEMAKAISQPREDLSKYAPRITCVQVPKDRIAEIIGPGGKIIKGIIAQTGCKIDISEDGKVNIASTDPVAAKKAVTMVQDIIAEVEVGKVYRGVVKKIVDFGAFVNLLPNQDGLLHISEIANERVNNVYDYLKEGDELEVKVIEVDRMGKIRLSRKILLSPPTAETASSHRPRGDRNGGEGRGGSGHGGPRGRGGYGGSSRPFPT